MLLEPIRRLCSRRRKLLEDAKGNYPYIRTKISGDKILIGNDKIKYCCLCMCVVYMCVVSGYVCGMDVYLCGECVCVWYRCVHVCGECVCVCVWCVCVCVCGKYNSLTAIRLHTKRGELSPKVT